MASWAKQESHDGWEGSKVNQTSGRQWEIVERSSRVPAEVRLERREEGKSRPLLVLSEVKQKRGKERIINTNKGVMKRDERPQEGRPQEGSEEAMPKGKEEMESCFSLPPRWGERRKKW